MSGSISILSSLDRVVVASAIALSLLAVPVCVSASDSLEKLPAPLTEPDISEPEGPGGLTLSAAEAAALAASPSMRRFEALVRAASWQSLQAGLPPNPVVGYASSEIGSEGLSGQQGAYFGQKFIRGGKLGFARAVASRESRRLEQELAAERLRVLTDTRTAFYDLYLTQREVRLAHELADLSRKAVEVSKQLREAGEGLRTDVLQAQIEQQRALAAVSSAARRALASWRSLAALTNMSADEAQEVVADRNDLLSEMQWAPTVAELLSTSPQIAERFAAIEKAQCEVAYQKSLAVQDLTAQVSVQYDDATNDTIAGVQVGVPLPVWNRNQGGIGRARAELVAARRRLESTEQGLRRRLADELGQYQAARVEAEALEAEVLPRASESLQLATEGYEAGELGFLDLLTVQRTYFQVSLELIDRYRDLNIASQRVRGCMLSGSGD